MATKPVKRVRKTAPVSMADYIYKMSPLRKGAIVVKNEDAPLANFDKIMSKLYLGNYLAAKDSQFFGDKKIKAVLNCTKDIPNTFAKKDIEYMRIPIDDSLKEIDINKAHLFMPAAVEFIPVSYTHLTLPTKRIV